MAPVKLVNEENIKEGQRIVKDCFERCIVLIRAPEDNFYCIEVPDTSFADADADKLLVLPCTHKHSVYRDTDGTLWVNLQENRKPVERPSLGDGLNLSNVVSQEPPPPPLVPFAGLDRKPMAPSPAKPFQIPASPLKPSPFKERVDTATEAVVRKNWTSRQAKMAGLFGAQKSSAPAAAAATESDV